MLHLDRGTISGILSRLERSRLVTRVSNPDDRRSVHLTLTARGRAVNRNRIGSSEFAVRRALARVPARDIAIARRLLAWVSGQLHAIASPRAGTRPASSRAKS